MRRRSRQLSWSPEPPRSIPKHPYRDTAVIYAVLAALIVLIAWATGRPILKALALAVAFFVAAVLWSWFNWRRRLAQAAAREEKS